MEIDNIFFNTADYKISHKIGEGSFGQVYAVKNCRDDKIYAAKKIKNQNFDGQEQMLFLRESIILHKLKHPAIIKFIGINFKSLSDSSTFEPTIITENMKNGSLKDIINKEKLSIADFNWTPTKKYISLLGIAHAMKYLHSHDIIHRDLKPENILIDSDYYPRIGDFGLSRCFPNSSSNSLKLSMTCHVGTPLYMAPELFEEDEQYGPSIDVYSFGILAYEILTANEPYYELGEKVSLFTLISKVVKGYRPKHSIEIPDKMWNLITKCWSENPEQRPTFEYIFDQLSSDMSYSSENVDEDEIMDYIEMLKKGELKERNKKDKQNKVQEEIDFLKAQIKKNNEEKITFSESNNDFCSALASILDHSKSCNYEEQIRKLERSSKKENSQASFVLGLLYENSKGVERDLNKSITYYNRSANQGNPKGFHRLGLCYAYGRGVPKDYIMARECFEKAAEFGDSDSLNELGILYTNGQGVLKDYNKAIDYFSKAADLDNSDALNNLGDLYEKVAADFSKAKLCYEKSAKLGNSYALNSLGLLYANGRGVPQDYQKASYYYKMAAKHKDSSALNNLGFLYANGLGVEQDYLNAIEYYKMAADLGDPISFYNLGVAYEHSKGDNQDFSKAIEYYQKAADLGISRAKDNLKKIRPKMK